jgi:adenylate cyclase
VSEQSQPSAQSSDKAVAESAPIERRLAAILAADFAGYSRLMHEDEERTLRTLTAHRKIVDALIVAANGKTFNTAGDSVLAEFPSVVEAYRCAVALQQSLARANAEVAVDARMEMRIGINLGDVMVTEGDLLGDGVNIACRLWELAEPGGICVTRAARDQLRDRAETAFADLGEHNAKNIARPIRAFKVIFDRSAEPELPESSREPETDAHEQEATKAEGGETAENAFWQPVQAGDDDAEYRVYLEQNPDGVFANLAQARLHGASAVEDTNVELAFWDTVRGSRDPAMLRAYLEKYPDGKFRALAEIMLGGLEGAGR